MKMENKIILKKHLSLPGWKLKQNKENEIESN